MNRLTLGKLSAIVLSAAVAAAGLIAHAETDSKRPSHGGWMLKKMDKDNSGTIDREEFRAPGIEYFKKLDANGDGVISLEEFTARTDERFAKMDANGDGMLDREELKDAHKKMRKSYGMSKGKHRNTAEQPAQR